MSGLVDLDAVKAMVEDGCLDYLTVDHVRGLVAEVERLRAALSGLAEIHGPGEVGEELEAMGEGLA